jgi:hypothetical protein
MDKVKMGHLGNGQGSGCFSNGLPAATATKTCGSLVSFFLTKTNSQHVEKT